MRLLRTRVDNVVDPRTVSARIKPGLGDPQPYCDCSTPDQISNNFVTLLVSAQYLLILCGDFCGKRRQQSPSFVPKEEVPVAAVSTTEAVSFFEQYINRLNSLQQQQQPKRRSRDEEDDYRGNRVKKSKGPGKAIAELLPMITLETRPLVFVRKSVRRYTSQSPLERSWSSSRAMCSSVHSVRPSVHPYLQCSATNLFNRTNCTTYALTRLPDSVSLPGLGHVR